MKIGEMEQHCGECKLIDYCGNPYQELCLCCDSRFENMEVDEYISLAETAEGSKEKIADNVCRTNRRKR